MSCGAFELECTGPSDGSVYESNEAVGAFVFL
jgi:hypothetical protein